MKAEGKDGPIVIGLGGIEFVSTAFAEPHPCDRSDRCAHGFEFGYESKRDVTIGGHGDKLVDSTPLSPYLRKNLA